MVGVVISSLGIPSVLDAAPPVTKPRAPTLVVALVVAFCGLLVSTDAGALIGLFVWERVIPLHPVVAHAYHWNPTTRTPGGSVPHATQDASPRTTNDSTPPTPRHRTL
jgi:hypothetical protein